MRLLSLASFCTRSRESRESSVRRQVVERKRDKADETAKFGVELVAIVANYTITRAP